MNTKSCFAPAHILLPSAQIPLEKWGCIACDQFTSDRDYWQKAEAAAAGSPSTLNLILPEVYLEDGDADARIEKIHAAMDDYAQNVLTRAVDGFIYVERTEQSGKVRQGLVGMVDLEAYSYRRGEKCTVRPSESTVESRIPPRKIKISFSVEQYHPNSSYVLCSDGFYKRCSFPDFYQDLLECYNRTELIHAIETTVDHLVKLGETDDITALVLTKSG